MATRNDVKLSEEQLYDPDLDDEGNVHLEDYLWDGDTSVISDPYLREVLDTAADELNKGIGPDSDNDVDEEDDWDDDWDDSDIEDEWDDSDDEDEDEDWDNWNEDDQIQFEELFGIKPQPTQHAEPKPKKSPIEELNEYVEQGRENTINLMAKLAAKIKSFKPLNVDLQTLAGLIVEEIQELRPQLEQNLTSSMFSSGVLGLNQTAAQVPFSISSTPIPETIKDDLVSILFPGNTTPPKVVLPVINAAVNALAARTGQSGDTYKQTAQLVRDGAFAITGDLTDHAVSDVKEQLGKALAEGLSQREFINVVSERLEKAGSPLAPAHLENVFRTNIMSAMSDAQNVAVQHPMVADAFPYAAYSATHDARVRPEHLALEKHGLDNTNIYRIDDPTFQKFRPPCDYNCRCTWTPVSVETAARKGVQEAKEWWERANAIAKQRNNSVYLFLNEAAPKDKQFVPEPPFNPSPEFKRELIQLEESPMVPYAKSMSVFETEQQRPRQQPQPSSVGAISFGELASAALDGLGASIGARIGANLADALTESLPKAIASSLQQTNINVNVPPTVVQMAEQQAPQIIVNVPEQPAPIVNVAAPDVHVSVPAPIVNVEPNIHVKIPEQKPQTIKIERDQDGRMTGISKE